MFCPNCGQENDPNSIFCEGCGERLRTSLLKSSMPAKNSSLKRSAVIHSNMNGSAIPQEHPLDPAASLQPDAAPFAAETSLNAVPVEPDPIPASPYAPDAVRSVPVEKPAFCAYCGQPISGSDVFCPYCGKRVDASDAPVSRPKEKSARKPRKKLGKRGVLILITAILALLVAGLAVWVITMFPLKVTIDLPNDAEMPFGEQQNIDLMIRSNQPVLSVQYALLSDDGSDPVYTNADLPFGLGMREAHLNGLTLHPGANDLSVRVKTLFGSFEQTLTLTVSIGYTAEPESDALVPVSEGMYLISNDLVLVFRESVTEEEIDDLIRRYNGTIVGQNYILGEYTVRFSGSGEWYINDLEAQLRNEPLIEDVFFDLVLEESPDYFPNDPGLGSWDVDSPEGNNWWLEAIDAPGAWEYRDRLKTVKIGIMDTWLYYDHEDLAVPLSHTHVLPSSSFKSTDEIREFYRKNDPTHEHYYVRRGNKKVCIYCEMHDHGTHCAGIAAAEFNNGKGISGVACNADLYFANFWYLNVYGNNQIECTSTITGFLHNLTYLVSSGCRVVSMSVGSAVAEENLDANGLRYQQSLAERYERTVTRLENMGYDFLVFKAAGNESADARIDLMSRAMLATEAGRNHTVIVGAAQNTSDLLTRAFAWYEGYEYIYNLADYSNYGDYIDVVAPGSYVYSTIGDGGYDYMYGTSMATPLAAGTACLIYGADPSLNYKSVKNILFFTYNHFCIGPNCSMYVMVNARRAVEWVLNHRSEVPYQERPAYGYVTGSIVDAQSKEPISNALVIATNIETGQVFTGETVFLSSQPEHADAANECIYQLYLVPGRYDIEFRADNYYSEVMYNVEISEGTVTYNMRLNLVTNSSEPGIASGYIIDAFDAHRIGGATLTFYRGVGTSEGEIVQTTYSDGNGYYQIQLDPGNYTLVAEAANYVQCTANVIVIPARTYTEQNCTMTPILPEGQVRIVLTWGEYPRDLDSHLIGPTPSGDQFHVFYDYMYSRNNGTDYVRLDVDDTSSYGPETITVYVPLNGTYTYCVHDYSNRHSSYSSELATSGATVTVYVGGHANPIVFNVPNQSGTEWVVFSLNGNVITPINSMRYQDRPSLVGIE